MSSKNLKISFENEKEKEVKEAWAAPEALAKRPSELGEMWSDWLRYSKTHGLDRLVISKSKPLKAIWFVALIASASLCSFLITRIIIDYLRFEVKTRIREVFVERVPFPTISVCNYNPLITPEANDYLRDYFKTELNMNVEKFADYFKDNRSDELYLELQYAVYRLNDPDFNKQKRESMGQKNLIACNIFGTDCMEEYTTYFDDKFGNCFIINPNKLRNGKPRETYEAYLRDLGLTLVQFIGTPESETSYLFDPDGMKGLLVRFQDFDQDDGLFMGGVGITAGTLARIVLNRVEVHNMPKPYSNCIPADMVDTKYSRLMREMDIPYSRKACIGVCYQHYIFDKIGCIQMNSLRIDGKPLCKSKDQFFKLLGVRFNFSVCTEDCPIECDSVRYETSVSYVNFPTYNTFYLANATNPALFQGLQTETGISYDVARKSVSAASIYFEEIKYTEIVETESMKFVDLVAAIGGMMGLFLGFSIMIIFELLELAIQFAFMVIKKRLRASSTKVENVY